MSGKVALARIDSNAQARSHGLRILLTLHDKSNGSQATTAEKCRRRLFACSGIVLTPLPMQR
ncbi:hypothetical protein [Caballeronia choica]|uniref:hypothetical protein n=1 Tax=Caballeronia choica TaxID=326476 RepID=UPI000F73D89E|nr:hypothetical protein [Caballeronia choica]